MKTELSKTLSYFLRHAPGEAGLDVDEYGFAPLDQVVEALENHNRGQLNVRQLVERVKSGGQKRFEVRGNRIRARYGHSFEVELDLEPVQPPDELYHGTSRQAWKSIREQGLKPKGRSYVHLSTTLEEARRVGRRHDANPVLLRVSPPGSAEPSFYQVAEDVVLVRQVPPGWIERLHPTNGG